MSESMRAPASWSQVNPGDVLVVRRPGWLRPFKFAVSRVQDEPHAGPGRWALLEGTRLRMSGQRSRLDRPQMLIRLECVEVVADVRHL
jgi:hypothetical protein